MSRKKDKTRDKSVLKWNEALAEAEGQTAMYKRKIYELNRSMQIMRENIASGAPWPGQQSATQN